MSGARSAILVRHCESSGQAPDAPLTALGREQAEQLARSLAAHEIARIVSSPYLRARESVAPLASRLGIELRIDARLAEHRLSAAPLDAWRDHVARAFVDLDTPAPGGDAPRATLARGWAALLDALSQPGSLLVSHGQLLSLVLHRIDPSFGHAGWRAMTNPDAFRVTSEPAGALRFERLAL